MTTNCSSLSVPFVRNILRTGLKFVSCSYRITSQRINRIITSTHRGRIIVRNKKSPFRPFCLCLFVQKRASLSEARLAQPYLFCPSTFRALVTPLDILDLTLAELSSTLHLLHDTCSMSRAMGPLGEVCDLVSIAFLWLHCVGGLLLRVT